VLATHSQRTTDTYLRDDQSLTFHGEVDDQLFDGICNADADRNGKLQDCGLAVLVCGLHCAPLLAEWQYLSRTQLLTATGVR
jgi:hypothetical protein